MLGSDVADLARLITLFGIALAVHLGLPHVINVDNLRRRGLLWSNTIPEVEGQAVDMNTVHSWLVVVQKAIWRAVHEPDS